MNAMAMPEGPNVLVSRQAVLLATGVGVGLLTLVYVLGVQVGKQSAALHAGALASGSELKELPAPLTEQLKAFETEISQAEKTRSEPPRSEEPRPAEAQEPPPKPEPKKEAAKAEARKEPAKAEPKKEAAKPEPRKEAPPPEPKKEQPKAAEAGDRWTQQLVTTTDPAEAKRIAARAKEAGYDTVEVKAGDAIRVRIKGRMAKTDADAVGAKLKEKGLKPFAVKVE
jgi:outer membrane biosynthesis protein TonB